MGGPNLSEMDIKVFIPAPTFLFTILQKTLPKWKKEKIFPFVVKVGLKTNVEMHDFK